MDFDKDDQIEYSSNVIKHESAGGFVFFEDPTTHELFVALLQRTDGLFVIPKGHLKKNESPELAAVREVKEELALLDDPEIISFLGISSYTFTLDDDPEIIHYKNVHNYVFRLQKKADIKPLKEEGYEKTEWIFFEKALEKISFDKENLLKARQFFYYNKPIKTYNSLSDISSITIVVPTHNGSKTIKNTLFSIKERMKEIPSSVGKEMIICTDHCTDNTENIVKDFIEENKKEINIRLINNIALKGKALVLNELFKNSSGELFCTIDDDVILEKECLVSLLNELISYSELRCVFSVWKRLPYKSNNPFKLFWYWVLGIKFDIQPYDKPQEFMRGACMMFRKNNYVFLPSILNEDQFIQYIYWPRVKEVQNSILYFNSVSSIFDYYKRSLRIMFGFKQLTQQFSKERFGECAKALSRKLNYKKIMSLPCKQKIPFLLYLGIKNTINVYRNIKLIFIKNYEWFRFKQD